MDETQNKTSKVSVDVNKILSPSFEHSRMKKKKKKQETRPSSAAADESVVIKEVSDEW